jgi:O-antigen/teichoic acid export membrane protein
MKAIRTIATRLSTTAVAWYWVFNGLRLASGVLLLPLLVAFLSETDLGMYYLLLSLNALGPLMDIGFLTAIDRGIGAAMGGARELRAFGMADELPARADPNYDLLWRLLGTTRWLYRIFAFGVLVILGIAGSYAVSYRIHETSSEMVTWIAWSLTLLATSFELYSSWWNIFLRGMNHVVVSARILVFVYFIRLLVSAALLAIGAGLLSIPVAALVSAMFARFWSRRACLTILLPYRKRDLERREIYGTLKLLWPNSWRIGTLYFSIYLTKNANALLCTHYFGLAANARYGLSMQLFTIAAGMAAVWTAVKWPLVQQLRARGEVKTMRQLLWPRWWLQSATFWCLATAAVFVIPFLLKFFSTGKSILPFHWLGLLALLIFLEMQFSFWSGVIATENRLPFLWPVVISNVVGLTLALCLVEFTNLGLGAFVLAPLVAGLLLNYWFWPIKAAQTMGTSLVRFLFQRGTD